MTIRHGTATWPGALSVVSCTYTLSHGISPGIAILKIHPQGDFPAGVGTLTISDGLETVAIPDCKIDSMLVEQDADGFLWSFTILDRRWKWAFGALSGCFNQLNNNGKLIPWTILGPDVVARRCLAAMGEGGAELIDLPEEMRAVDGIPWFPGVQPVTGTNPPVNWEAMNPAQALAQWVELFGRRVIYRLTTNRVMISIPGRIAAQLPDGSIARESPTINSPETPAGVAVVGAYTRFQGKFNMNEAVGKEWDGHYVPIDELSYAPLINGAVQINTATATCDGGSNIFQVFIGDADETATSGTLFEVTTNSAATAVATLAAAINASQDPKVKNKVAAVDVGGGVLRVSGLAVGVPFGFFAKLSGGVVGNADFLPELVQAARRVMPGWEFSQPPEFPGVRETNRLTLEEARALARESVFRCYRLVPRDPATGRNALIVPGFGPVRRRHQIVLLPTMVEQVVPIALDQNLVNPNLGGLQNAGNAAAIENFYNGFSRDKPAQFFGSASLEVLRDNGHLWWAPHAAQLAAPMATGNSQRTDRIYVPFEIIPDEQIVKFSVPVYRLTGNQQSGLRVAPIGNPVIETACYVRTSHHALARSSWSRPMPNRGAADTIYDGPDANWNRYHNHAVKMCDDIQEEFFGVYSAALVLLKSQRVDQDALARANHYLDTMTVQYLYERGLTREYNGIKFIDCDGGIQQVTWEVGPNGASTVASQNTEHSVYIPPYPARRRKEFLAAANQDAIAAAVNPQRLGRALVDPGRY